MMNRYISVIPILLITLSAYGQTSTVRESILEARQQYASNSYQQSYTAHILTGRKYKYLYPNALNSAFFRGDEMTMGTLVYDGRVFENIEIQYDLFINKVVAVMETDDNSYYITLDSDKVDQFSFEGHDFLHVRGDSIMQNDIYHVLHDGNRGELYAKRMKSSQRKIIDRKTFWEFHDDNEYYVRNEAGTYRISSKKDFYAAFSYLDNLDAIIKAVKLKFSKDKIESGLMQALEMIDQQTNSIAYVD